jgi:hypothetical protein
MHSLALSYTAMSEHFRLAIRHQNTSAQFSQLRTTHFVQTCNLAAVKLDSAARKMLLPQYVCVCVCVVYEA